MRRTRWESRVLAVQIMNAYAEMMGKGRRTVSADTMLGTMGVKL